jgi:hypothetical protein
MPHLANAPSPHISFSIVPIVHPSSIYISPNNFFPIIHRHPFGPPTITNFGHAQNYPPNVSKQDMMVFEHLSF